MPLSEDKSTAQKKLIVRSWRWSGGVSVCCVVCVLYTIYYMCAGQGRDSLILRSVFTTITTEQGQLGVHYMGGGLIGQ